jgi:antitoxin (DNA-binding transcriptional repressor) of toxin-antitoxin stability system
MTTISIEDFIQDYMLILDKIQKGDSFLLMKNNKPLAELVPLTNQTKKWKRLVNPIQLSSEISMTDFIRQERDSK